jgi:DnaB helicase-like protein
MRAAVCTISKFLRVRPNSLFDGSAIKQQSPAPAKPLTNAPPVVRPKVASEPQPIRPDMAAERGVLAGIWKYGRDCLLGVQDIINEGSFSDPTNRILFSAFCRALKNSSSLDLATLMSTAYDMGVSELLDKHDEVELFRAITNFPVNKENVRVLASKLLPSTAKPQATIEEQAVSNIVAQQFDDDMPSDLPF